MKLPLIQIPGPALVGFDHIFTGEKKPAPPHRCPVCGVEHGAEKKPVKENLMMGLDFLGL